MKQIKDFDVKSKTVLVRCDFNTPLDGCGSILDDGKIKETLPTLQYLIKNQAKVVILTHLGEPEGHVVENLKLNVIKDALEKLLGFAIKKSNDCIGGQVKKNVGDLAVGEVLLLENVRFHKEEMENNLSFAKKLSELGDIYVNEAFDVCHRSHASVVGITQFLPSAMGFALQKEVEVLSNIMAHPKRPMVAIIGGAKVTTKAHLVDGFCAFADLVIISGLIKQELVSQKIHLQYPEKVFGPKEDLGGLDIGLEDIRRITSQILQAKTIVWNGPFGKVEDQNHKQGTIEIAKAIMESEAFSVVGGGQTLAFLKQEGMLDKFSHVSTGGGAMLSFLAGEELPGLVAIDK